MTATVTFNKDVTAWGWQLSGTKYRLAGLAYCGVSPTLIEKGRTDVAKVSGN